MKKQTEKTWGGYDLIRTSRKTIAIQITLDGDVTVRAPRDCEKAEIDDLIRDRREWIEEKRAEFLAQKRECEKKQEQFPKITPESEREFRRLAKEKIPKRVALFRSGLRKNHDQGYEVALGKLQLSGQLEFLLAFDSCTGGSARLYCCARTLSSA